MFTPSSDALCHFDSYILSWKNCSLKKEEVLNKINVVVAEYATSSYNLDKSTHYDFINMHCLKSHKKVYQSRICLSGFEKDIVSNQDQENTHQQHNKLLVGFITTEQHNISSDTGQIFLEDNSGAIVLLSHSIRPCLLGSLVVIPEWIYIPCLNEGNIVKQHVEVNSNILDLNIHPCDQQRQYLIPAEIPRRERSKRETDLSGKVMYLSPIHKVAGSSPFFMAKLESEPQPIIVLGEEKMCWWQFMRPGLVVDFMDVKYSRTNKGSIEERDIIKTTPESTISIFDEKQTEVGSIETDRKNGDFISYMGKVTDCSMAERGIFEIDNRLRLIVTHQPCEAYCSGLRVGAKICAYNVHLVVFPMIPYLVCCTCSTIKVTEYSSFLADHKPFVAFRNCFARNCQEMRIKDYLFWSQVSDDLINRFPFLTESKAATLAKTLLYEYLSYRPMRRNVFQEFFSQPHRCDVTSENRATPPKVCSLASIKSMLHKSFIESSETMPWSRGDEYDRLSSHNCETGNSWSYKLISPEDVENIIILGELDICNADGQLRLKDKSGAIDLQIIPNKLRNDKHRVNIFSSEASTLLSDEKSIIVLRRYFLVLEKIENFGNPSLTYKIYVIADTKANGNSIFYSKIHVSKPDHTGKQNGTIDIHTSTSKRKRCDDTDFAINKNAKIQGNSALNEVSKSVCSLTGRQRSVKSDNDSCTMMASVRSTLILRSANKRRNFSFSGIITSRSIKVSYPWGVEKRTSVVLLRVRDFKSLDEIAVYICPHKFPLPGGCLPGARVHFADIEMIVSQAKKIYCSVTTSTEIRIICFHESDLKNLKEYSPMVSAPGLIDPACRRNLKYLLGNNDDVLNLTWEVRLDFLAVRWAEIYWKCRMCKQKVAELLCSRGCPQEWNFISQMSTIVDDGTIQAHLQIEQHLFQCFLALPGAQWTQILETAKFGEITYQRETEQYIEESLYLAAQSDKPQSQRRHVENLLWKLFRNITDRPTYIVHCKLYNQKRKHEVQDQIRTIKIGNDELLTKAPKRINLQAVQISRIDYSTEIIHLLKEMTAQS